MHKLFQMGWMVAMALAGPVAAQPAPAQSALPQLAAPASILYELRIYTPFPGKLAALNSRFEQHTLGLFARHGMANIAYWNEMPSPEQSDGRVVYVLAYPDRAARDAAWRAFSQDPEWRAVAAASEAQGKLVAKVESIFMTKAPYSP